MPAFRKPAGQDAFYPPESESPKRKLEGEQVAASVQEQRLRRRLTRAKSRAKTQEQPQPAKKAGSDKKTLPTSGLWDGTDDAEKRSVYRCPTCRKPVGQSRKCFNKDCKDNQLCISCHEKARSIGPYCSDCTD